MWYCTWLKLRSKELTLQYNHLHIHRHQLQNQKAVKARVRKSQTQEMYSQTQNSELKKKLKKTSLQCTKGHRANSFERTNDLNWIVLIINDIYSKDNYNLFLNSRKWCVIKISLIFETNFLFHSDRVVELPMVMLYDCSGWTVNSIWRRGGCKLNMFTLHTTIFSLNKREDLRHTRPRVTQRWR